MTVEIKRVDGLPDQYTLEIDYFEQHRGSLAECVGYAVQHLIEEAL